MEMPALIDDRLQYVVSMEPKGATLYPLMYGKLFINGRHWRSPVQNCNST